MTGGGVETRVRALPGVLSCSFLNGTLIVLVEPEVDAAAVENLVGPILAEAGERARIQVVGGFRPPAPLRLRTAAVAREIAPVVGAAGVVALAVALAVGSSTSRVVDSIVPDAPPVRAGEPASGPVVVSSRPPPPGSPAGRAPGAGGVALAPPATATRSPTASPTGSPSPPAATVESLLAAAAGLTPANTIPLAAAPPIAPVPGAAPGGLSPGVAPPTAPDAAVVTAGAGPDTAPTAAAAAVAPTGAPEPGPGEVPAQGATTGDLAGRWSQAEPIESSSVLAAAVTDRKAKARHPGRKRPEGRVKKKDRGADGHVGPGRDRGSEAGHGKPQKKGHEKGKAEKGEHDNGTSGKGKPGKGGGEGAR